MRRLAFDSWRSRFLPASWTLGFVEGVECLLRRACLLPSRKAVILILRELDSF